MKYECHPADREHYATGLTLDPQEKRLSWTSLPGQDSLLVQTPYGADPSKEADRLRDALQTVCRQRLPEGRFHPISDRFSVRYVSAEEKARNRGCRYNGEACAYAVFSCVTDPYRDLCDIYVEGGRGAMSSPSCDVPMNVRIEVTPVIHYTGFFLFRREAPTEFFRVRFPDPCDPNYRDGDLEYSVDERWRIPVTRLMFEAGEIYIRSAKKPKFKSRNEGVRLKWPE